MNATHRFVRTYIRPVLALCIAGFFLGAGCKAKGPTEAAKTKDGAKVEAKDGAKPAEAVPCPEFVNAICDKAGKESPTCESAKSVADLLSPAACRAAAKDAAYAVQKLADQRKKCDELAQRLCKDLGEATETCKMVQTQTKTFPPDRCVMMLGQYDKVLADLRKMEDANKPLPPEKQAAIAKNDAPSFGPANAKVTIVEFSDFQCPYCSRAADVAHKVKEKFSDKVRFVFRQFPLSFHQNAQLAAEASLAANAQGKFWEMHDKMFQNQTALERPSLEKYAKEIGLDMAKFKKDLDKQFAAAVAADLKLGGEVAVNGTPTMFINGARVTNPTDFEALTASIEKELKK